MKLIQTCSKVFVKSAPISSFSVGSGSSLICKVKHSWYETAAGVNNVAKPDKNAIFQLLKFLLQIKTGLQKAMTR